MSNFTPAWFKKGFFNESLFCDDFLSTHQLLYSNGAFFTPDGRMVDPMPLRCEIFEMMREYVGANLAKKVTNVVDVLKLAAQVEDFPPVTDRIALANGTLYLDGTFQEGKPEIVRNRLPVKYDPKAAQPVHWLRFLSDLLYPEDIPTVQEFIGYCLIPSNKGQRMMVIKGNGGEGKSWFKNAAVVGGSGSPAYPIVYAIRFKGTAQCAAYRYENKNSGDAANGELEIRIKALQANSLLTIGDGLVSTIPSIIVSTGTGLLVSRAASEAKMGEEFLAQLTFNSQALKMVSGVLLVFALVPGLPTIPFQVLSILLLPLVLIFMDTGLNTLSVMGVIDKGADWVNVLRMVGKTPVALLITVLYALWLFRQTQGKVQLEKFCNDALAPVCAVILVTGAGGMFGGVLRASGIGTALADVLSDTGMPVILAAFLVSAALRVAQGSATVALTTTAALMAPTWPPPPA
mgnify:CR=1 FL=1